MARRPQTAQDISTDRHLTDMETLWFIERKGWKMTFILPNIGPTLYEKEIDGKRVTLTKEHAFTYEEKLEEPRGYEY
jgi:hypothetical protein